MALVLKCSIYHPEARGWLKKNYDQNLELVRDTELTNDTQKVNCLVSARNHLSPQILYSYHKLSEWALLCRATDKLGREAFSEKPETRN